MSYWSNLAMTFPLHGKEFQFESGIAHWSQGQKVRRLPAKQEY